MFTKLKEVKTRQKLKTQHGEYFDKDIWELCCKMKTCGTCKFMKLLKAYDYFCLHSCRNGSNYKKCSYEMVDENNV